MIAESIYFRGHRCFKKDWVGFDTIKPINVIIGRNNTGKSHLLDFVLALCKNNGEKYPWELKCSGVLDEETLLGVFNSDSEGGALDGNHWDEHGKKFVNAPVDWELDRNGVLVTAHIDEAFDGELRAESKSTKGRASRINKALKTPRHKLNGARFRRLSADRDIHLELEGLDLALDSKGSGATNIIRRYIYTTNPKYAPEVVQKNLLEALNHIFGKDGEFVRIEAKKHDDPEVGGSVGLWEIHLSEEKKVLFH